MYYLYLLIYLTKKLHLKLLSLFFFIPSEKKIIKYINKKKIIWHVCTPKSASTFFMNFMKNAKKQSKYGFNTDFFSPVPHAGSNRFNVVSDIYIYKQISTMASDALISTHQHTLPTNDMLKLISNKHSVIVQYRNIFDTIISLSDYITKYFQKSMWYPMDLINWNNKGKLEKNNYLIDFYLPWHINFMYGWFSQKKNKNINFISYDDIINDPRTIAKNYLELEIGEHVILDKEKSLFNKGVKGRGKKELNIDQISQIEARVNKYIHEKEILKMFYD